MSNCFSLILIRFTDRISGNAASTKNIHSSVSEQLKKNFAKSRWRVSSWSDFKAMGIRQRTESFLDSSFSPRIYIYIYCPFLSLLRHWIFIHSVFSLVDWEGIFFCPVVFFLVQFSLIGAPSYFSFLSVRAGLKKSCLLGCVFSLFSLFPLELWTKTHLQLSIAWSEGSCRWLPKWSYLQPLPLDEFSTLLRNRAFFFRQCDVFNRARGAGYQPPLWVISLL